MLLPWKTVNKKQYFIPIGSTNNSATIKDLKDMRVVILTTTSFKQLPIWLVKKKKKQVDLDE